jgi:hypothetical protein
MIAAARLPPYRLPRQASRPLPAQANPRILEPTYWPCAKGRKLAGLVGLGLVAGAGLEQNVLNRTELAVQSLQALLPQLVRLSAPSTAASQATEMAGLLDLLVVMRGRLRAAGQWALADQIRDGLAPLGYTLQDTPEGTVWLADR